jgi:hypothetical protein
MISAVLGRHVPKAIKIVGLVGSDNPRTHYVCRRDAISRLAAHKSLAELTSLLVAERGIQPRHLKQFALLEFAMRRLVV